MQKYTIGQRVKVLKGEYAGQTGRVTEYHKFSSSKCKPAKPDEHYAYDLLITGSTAIGITEDDLAPA